MEIIFDVRVERILALTPLPSPSARTMTCGILVLTDDIDMVAAKLLSVMIYAFPADFGAKVIHL